MIVISLYSYKGGAGRTVCTANLVGILAEKLKATKKNPILLLDMDLDSAGLTHVLDEYNRFKDSYWNISNLINGNIHLGVTEQRNVLFNKDKKVKLDEMINRLKEAGLVENKITKLRQLEFRKGIVNELRKLKPEIIVDILKDYNINENIEDVLERNVPAIGMVDVSEKLGVPEGSVRFIGAEQVGRDTIVEGTATEKMKELIEVCEEEGFSAIIIDSASGRQQSALICHNVSRLIIYCCRLTYQFRIGTKLQLRHFIDRAKKGFRNIPYIIIMPVAIPNVNVNNKKVREQKVLAMADLKDLSNEIGQITQTYFFQNGIPEVESFKWHEHILKICKDLDEDEKEALSVFNALAEKVTEISLEVVTEKSKP